MRNYQNVEFKCDVFLGSALSWETSSRLVQENGGKCRREGKGGNLPRNNRFAKSKKGKVSEWEQGSGRWEVSGWIFLHFVFFFFLTIYGPTSFFQLMTVLWLEVWRAKTGWGQNVYAYEFENVCAYKFWNMCDYFNDWHSLTLQLPKYAYHFPLWIYVPFSYNFINLVLSDLKTSPPFLSF